MIRRTLDHEPPMEKPNPVEGFIHSKDAKTLGQHENKANPGDLRETIINATDSFIKNLKDGARKEKELVKKAKEYQKLSKEIDEGGTIGLSTNEKKELKELREAIERLDKEVKTNEKIAEKSDKEIQRLKNILEKKEWEIIQFERIGNKLMGTANEEVIAYINRLMNPIKKWKDECDKAKQVINHTYKVRVNEIGEKPN